MATDPYTDTDAGVSDVDVEDGSAGASPSQEPTEDGSAGALPSHAPDSRDKLRLRFSKDGSLRWLSHHDLMRTFERILRRAELPFRRSQGFHPHPRIVFALSLPLGVIGRAEVVEIELAEPIPPDEALARLARQCPSGLAFIDAKRIPFNRSARVTGFTYGLRVPADRLQSNVDLPSALAQVEWWVERSKPTRRRLDIRPFVRDLRIDATAWLEMDLWFTDRGTARPDEVLGLVGLAGLLEAGVPLERVRLELEDESAVSNADCSTQKPE